MLSVASVVKQPSDLPKFSIVTPSFNQGEYVEWTVRSVLLQRYPNLEYIFMDGGSDDGTIERLERYRAYFSRFESEPDLGQADALARGLLGSTGEIMAYLNSDDLLAPDTLQFVARFFAENPRIDALYSHRCAINESNVVIYYWILPRHSSYLQSRWDLIPQETCFWRRSLWERAGNIDPSFDFAMDYDLFFRFMRVGRFRRVNRFLGAFREHGGSKTVKTLNTRGVEEVQRVWAKYDIPNRRFHPFLYRVFERWVETSSARFVNSRRRLPGALPATGYHYDEVWGRQLTDAGLPPL